MKRMMGHGRGKWVATPKDFFDLGPRTSVYKALSRLVSSGTLRRIDRGFYDLPKINETLKRPSPPSLDAIVDAIGRRDNAILMPALIVAASNLGLTNMVPSKPTYLTSKSIGKRLEVAGWDIQFEPAPPVIIAWATTPAASAVQAIFWLGEDRANNKEAISNLRRRLTPSAKRSLRAGRNNLPPWAINAVKQIVASPRAKPL